MKRKSLTVLTKLWKPTQPPAVVGEREIERVDRRGDAEEDQQRQVRQDEGQAPPRAGATLMRGPRILDVRTQEARVVTSDDLVPAALALSREALPRGGSRELSDLPSTSFVTTVFDQRAGRGR